MKLNTDWPLFSDGFKEFEELIKEADDKITTKKTKHKTFFTWGQFWPPGIVVACVRPSVCCQVCPRDNSTPVQARLTKFGQKMQNTLAMVPIVFWGQSSLTLKVKFNLKVKIYPILSLSTQLTHHPFKLGSPNLEQRCKIHWLRSLLFWDAIDLQDQIWLKMSNFLTSTLLEIHHITTREPWVPRLLHRPDCFMVSILCTYLYT